MPRRKKEVKIDERKFVVQELTVKEIIDYFETTQNALKKPELTPQSEDSEMELMEDPKQPDLNTASTDFFKKELQKFLDLALKGEHKWEDFINFAPSDLEELWNAFKEVNSTFFGIARAMGVDQALMNLASQLRSEFLGVLVASSSRAIPES